MDDLISTGAIGLGRLIIRPDRTAANGNWTGPIAGLSPGP
jgi:hypothetical protein